MAEKHHSETAGEYRKYRNRTGPGKGDERRPGDTDAYREGWERIFGKSKTQAKVKDRAMEKIARGPGSCPEFA